MLSHCIVVESHPHSRPSLLSLQRIRRWGKHHRLERELRASYIETKWEEHACDKSSIRPAL
jgi:hypothetical protein